MKIWVDADALPAASKAIHFRAAERLAIPLAMVANKPLKIPPSPYLSSMVVEAGLDIADDWIVRQVEAGDLVITADIPLASRVVAQGATALDPRGLLYTEQNINERLALRNLLTDLRNNEGMSGGGPSAYSAKDAQKFANQLNSYLGRKAD